MSSIPRALTGLIYQQKSLSSARNFTHSLFLNRTVDIKSLIRFRDPKLTLVETVAKFKRERPVSRYVIKVRHLGKNMFICANRLLKETGRLSNSPIFVVGIYSGADKLGEGFGSSLKMAEYRVSLWNLRLESCNSSYLCKQP